MRRGRKHQRSFSAGIKVRAKASTGAKAPKKKKESGALKSIIYSVSICVFVVLIALCGIGAGMYASIVREIKEMNVQEMALTRSSIVYYTDENGNSKEAATLFSDGNCIWVDANEIPQVMKDAIVAIEDERFYRHGGVDIKRTAGAAVGWVREKLGGARASYGGSTLTQQVVKNITQEKDRSVMRKIKEMMRAVALERELSKDEIITMYLNVIYLANNCYGVEAASNMYFDKSVADLNISEAALIAGITQRPSYYDPLKNPENATKRRNTVLMKMNELGTISDEEYNSAVETDLGLSGNHARVKSKVYSYFIDSVINEVINDLQTEKGYTETFATQQVFSGGLKIYTTMDMNIQNAMEEVFESGKNFPSGASKAQAAMIVMDQYTGEIKGVIGGKGEKTEPRGLNRATQSRRQPGSSIKPLSVYAPAIEKGVVTPLTKVKDEPLKIKEWEPQNSYTGFKGNMTVKKAVEISANIPAIKVLQDLGLSTSYDYAKNKFRLGITEEDRDLSPLALGGLTKGVTAKEMAAAFSVFANNGEYIEPHTYTKVLDNTNRVLLEKSITRERVISESTAYVMTDMLYNVVNGESGTGKLARVNGMNVYGKTGTTNNNYDKWFIGYTPYYTGAVWFGFDQQKSIKSAGINYNISAQLWSRVMTKVHQGLESKAISASSDMVSAYVCPITGFLAADGCDAAEQYFTRGTEPTKYCDGDHSESYAYVEMDPEDNLENVTPAPVEERPSDKKGGNGSTVGDFISIEDTYVDDTVQDTTTYETPEPQAPEDDAVTLD